MIFVTLGSQKFQFDRLLKALDELIAGGSEELFAQTGYSDYKPKHFKYKNFLDRNEYDDMMNKADIVITHGGSGACIGAVKRGKKVIAVPRLAEYGEHVDNHQLELVSQFKELNLIYECLDCNDLPKALQEIKSMAFSTYVSGTEKVIQSIESHINELGV